MLRWPVDADVPRTTGHGCMCCTGSRSESLLTAVSGGLSCSRRPPEDGRVHAGGDGVTRRERRAGSGSVFTYQPGGAARSVSQGGTARPVPTKAPPPVAQANNSSGPLIVAEHQQTDKSYVKGIPLDADETPGGASSGNESGPRQRAHSILFPVICTCMCTVVHLLQSCVLVPLLLQVFFCYQPVTADRCTKRVLAALIACFRTPRERSCRREESMLALLDKRLFGVGSSRREGNSVAQLRQRWSWPPSRRSHLLDYGSDEEHREVLTRFLKERLERDERVLYLAAVPLPT
jgi:hypothetical protein